MLHYVKEAQIKGLCLWRKVNFNRKTALLSTSGGTPYIAGNFRKNVQVLVNKDTDEKQRKLSGPNLMKLER
eukprot:1158853-Pelagomonas_calceolata.AAC.4